MSEYRFKISAYTPETIPMVRLAEYMQDLATLFGEQEHVHFVRIEEGSTTLVQRVDPASAPKVHAHIKAIEENDCKGPQEVRPAIQAINHRLAKDNAEGHLYQDNDKKILYFPGYKQDKPLTFKVPDQASTLDGLLIRIGGKGKTVPVHLQEGDTIYNCSATRDMARHLACHLYAAKLRVHGNGNWERDEKGNWNLKRFDITRFEVLDDTPLREVVADLRQVPGNGWKDIEDPYAELQHLRRG